MHDAVIIDAVRTPVGRQGGALAGVRPDDLAAVVVKRLSSAPASIRPLVEEVYLGCANQAGEDNRDVARMAVLLAGLPQSCGRCDLQPALRVGAERGQPGRARDQGRRGGRVRRRRRRVDEPLALLDAQGRTGLPHRAHDDL